MSENLKYSIETLATWVGWALGAWALYRLLVIFLLGSPGDRLRASFGAVVAGMLSALLLTISSRMIEAPGSNGIRLPLIWFVMPLSAWVGVIATTMCVVRCGQALVQLRGVARTGLFKSSFIWAIVAGICAYLYIRGGDRIQLLRGGIDLGAGTAAAIVILVVVCMAAMKGAAQYSASRGWSRAIASHLLLITGSIVFGIPFAFLAITSFKEDRDMSSPNGIVWVPRVQQTVTYWDKKDPLLEAKYQGQKVNGSIISTNPDGTVELEIIDPGAMRGLSFIAKRSDLKEIPKQIPLVTASLDGRPIQGKVVEDMLDGSRRVEVTQPAALAGRQHVYKPNEVEPVREIGLKWQNYPDALAFLPPETDNGLVYLKNTLLIVIFSVIGTVLSSSIVAFAFARMRFPGRDTLFAILLATMMLPSAVTLLPKFLIFRQLGWIDSLYPLWVPAFFASAFNVFLLRQFFKNIPSELEDAARIDGCSPARTFWSVMLPLVRPALAVIAIWSFKDNWNNFMEPLIYIASPEKMPLSYALQLFQGDRGGEPGMLMAFSTLTILPVLLLFFFAQKYFVEGVTLSGLGGR